MEENIKHIDGFFNTTDRDGYQTVTNYNTLKLEECVKRVVIEKTKGTQYYDVYNISSKLDNDDRCRSLRCKNIECIEEIKLEIGGEKYEVLYNSQFKTLRRIYGIEDDNIVPFYIMIEGIPKVRWHEIELYIKSTSECELTVEVINDKVVSMYDDSYNQYTREVYLVQDVGKESLPNENKLDTCHSLWYNYRCYALFFSGNEEWDKDIGVKLMFSDGDKYMEMKVEGKDIVKIGEYYCINLYNGINFSVIRDVKIIPGFENKFTIIRKRFVVHSGMCGLRIIKYS